ncbi:MAG: beta-glycosidase, partial [Tannerella sp.]|nr:beta-glycosidase [Tannerella sp.]
MRKSFFSIGWVCLAMSCTQVPQISWVSTTPESGFAEQPALAFVAAAEDGEADVTVLTDHTLQEIDGFGGCFNELGWVTIASL